jgi:foldase protein PrsA
MLDRNRGRTDRTWLGVTGLWLLVGVGAVGFSGLDRAVAQQTKGSPPPARTGTRSNAPEGEIKITRVRTLVSPNEPIAIVNGHAITRQQLADACVARRGEEILETLIARELIDQEMKKRKISIAPAEVDAEIERVARTVAHVSKEQWLAALADKKKISPSQYAHDIIYPSLALRKLTADQIRVTDEEIAEALESYYGEKLKCRIMMFDKLATAKQTWEDLKKTPGAWDKLVAERSIDQATRSVGGMLTEPIARHAEPRHVSDAAFSELVDIDPNITTDDPVERKKYTPKDGDITGVIQVAEGSWVIMRREGLEPKKKVIEGDKKLLVEQFRQTLHDAKLEGQIGVFYAELLRRSQIENRLTGDTKMANEEQEPQSRVDGDVQLMSHPATSIPEAHPGAGAAPAPGHAKTATAPPPGVDPADVKKLEKLRKPSGK